MLNCPFPPIGRMAATKIIRLMKIPKIPPIFASSLLILIIIIGVVLAVRFGNVPGWDIYLEAHAAPPLISGNKINLRVRLVLKNPSGRVQYLAPQNTCRVLRWFVLDNGSAFVQSKPKRPTCLPAQIQRGLQPWEEVEEVFIMILERRRFKPNESYFLIIEFWGLRQSVAFKL